MELNFLDHPGVHLIAQVPQLLHQRRHLHPNQQEQVHRRAGEEGDLRHLFEVLELEVNHTQVRPNRSREPPAPKNPKKLVPGTQDQLPVH